MKSKNYFILNKNNLVHNAVVIKNSLNKNTKLCAMVKANAYGHGLKFVCQSLFGLAVFFGVATVKEAKQIRSFDTTTPILIVGLVEKNNYYWCSKNNVSVTIDSIQKLKQIQKLNLKSILKVHFKINTGMNRFGFSNIYKFLKAFAYTKQIKTVKVEGVFTHFAMASNENFIKHQFNLFMKFLDKINKQNLIIHCCNSYACRKFPNMHKDMVRVGFDLYGYSQKPNLRPVLKIYSTVIAVQSVKKGQSIGYNRAYIAKKNMKIAVISLGYADGFNIRCSNKTSVIINNKICPVVGKVCMDVFMVDISKMKNLKLGEKVLILGCHNTLNLTPQYYAKKIKTSPYEVLVNWKPYRMKKLYK